MIDAADRADEEIAHETAEALRARKPLGPAATGFCHYCREPVALGLRWCPGTECRVEWEREGARRLANGLSDG